MKGLSSGCIVTQNNDTEGDTTELIIGRKLSNGRRVRAMTETNDNVSLV